MPSFTFDSVHSSEYGVYFSNVDRTLLPSKRIIQYVIPGRDGTYEVENGYEPRDITCVLGFTGDDFSREELRAKARAVAQWLSGFGLLVFDDEPDKGYKASVVNGVSIEEVAATGKASVAFHCQPFAERLVYSLAATGQVALPKTAQVVVEGTQATDAMIYIKAAGTIKNVTVKRLTTY